MNINIDINTLLKLGLTLSEYTYLLYLYLGEETPDLYKVIDYVDENKLQDKNYIKITKDETVLRSKGIELFENKNLFLKFLNTFPIKAPSGRYLSPLGNTGKAVKDIEKKFNTLFKNKPHLQQKAIDVLEAELDWRKRTNQLEYIHSIDVWLNKHDYEKFEYLLEEDKQSHTDLM